MDLNIGIKLDEKAIAAAIERAVVAPFEVRDLYGKTVRAELPSEVDKAWKLSLHTIVAEVLRNPAFQAEVRDAVRAGFLSAARRSAEDAVKKMPKGILGLLTPEAP